MAYGKRTRWALGLVLTAAAALAAQGCTSGSAQAPSATSAASGSGSAAVTPAEASAVFRAYVATSTQAAVTGNQQLALSDLTGVQWYTVKAGYTTAKFFGQRPPYARYAYRSPVFYLPGPGGYPLNFVAVTQRTPVTGGSARSAVSAEPAPGGLGGTGSPPKPGGHRGVGPRGPAEPPGGKTSAANSPGGMVLPGGGRVLMLFTKPSATYPWQLASISQLAPGTSLPALATGAGGYVQAASDTPSGLLVQPSLVGPLQAAVVDDGPASVASRVVGSGLFTTGMYQAARSAVQGVTAPAGDIRQWELEGSGYSRLALRTADGGALVYYAMYLNTTIATPGYINKANPVPRGPVISVPRDLTPFLKAGQLRPRKQLTSQELLSFVAIDPPASAKTAKIQVIAIGGGLHYASAS